jgi:nitroimidazol reductase NimA-like FMN-containing flavoprotein (pyridoxamine 5'-phosphate oxidase superfamily)
MREPVAELDSRFSGRDAQTLPWPRVREALEKSGRSRISTVRADGRPHVTPLVAVWLDDTLYLCTGPGEQEALMRRRRRSDS